MVLRAVPLVLLLAACEGKDAPADDTDVETDTDVDTDTDDTDTDDDTDVEGPRLTVKLLDPDGEPLAVQRVGWHAASAQVPVPLREALTALGCAEGVPPCDTWVLDDATLPTRIHVLAELVQPERAWTGGDTDTSCFYWASQHTIVQVPEGASPQVVHLVLDPDALWCETLLTAGPVPPIPAPTVHPLDVRVETPAPGGPTAVLARDADGTPLPTVTAVWYYPPDGPSFDGEHELDCVDALCTEWALPAGASPEGAFHVASTYVGPYIPISGATFTDFQAARPDDASELPVTLTFDAGGVLIE